MPVSVQTIIPFILFLCRILIPLLILPGSDFVNSLDTPSWVRVEEGLVRYSEIRSMDQQVVTVDQFAVAMASIQEALASLRQEINGQQSRPPMAQDDAQYDPTVPPPPPPSQSAPQAMLFTMHSQTGVAPPPIVVPTLTSEDPHARMDRLEQGLRQLRTSDQ